MYLLRGRRMVRRKTKDDETRQRRKKENYSSSFLFIFFNCFIHSFAAHLFTSLCLLIYPSFSLTIHLSTNNSTTHLFVPIKQFALQNLKQVDNPQHFGSQFVHFLHENKGSFKYHECISRCKDQIGGWHQRRTHPKHAANQPLLFGPCNFFSERKHKEKMSNEVTTSLE